MYEYKVLCIELNDAEDKMNEMAAKGWRLIHVSRDEPKSLLAVFEKRKENRRDKKKEMERFL